MKNKLIITGLVFWTIILFVGTSIIPMINASNSPNNNENPKAGGGTRDIIFSDDFNDNTKDFTKWTEVFNSGNWSEKNQRTEFKMYEISPHWRYEGIQSESFTVILTSNESIVVSADMITDIDHSQGQWVGNIDLTITDGINAIEAFYSRGYDSFYFDDSNDTGTTLLKSGIPDGTYTASIELFSDKYKVKMGTYESGWVTDNLFGENPTLKVQIHIQLAGDYPNFYWIAGFDNVKVEAELIPLNIKITSPQEFSWVGGKTVEINGTCSTQTGYIARVLVNIQNHGWEDAILLPDKTQWTYTWHTSDFVEETDCTIQASCFNSSNAEARDEVVVKVDLTGPEISLLFPLNRTFTILGRPFPLIPFSVLIGMCPLYVRIIDRGCEIVTGCSFNLIWFSYPYKFEMKNIGVGVWKTMMQGIPFWRIGPCTLEITASDKLGNENIFSYRFFKIF